MNKKNLLVIFGGRSTEHEVSRVSAGMILDNADNEKYNLLVVGITKTGKWLFYEDYDVDKIKDGSWEKEGCEAYIVPSDKQNLIVIEDKNVRKINIDVVFNIIHGNTGEDGKLQGLLELAGIPYVGCNTVSSAVCMDKAFTKLIVEKLNIRQAKYAIVKDVPNLEDIETRLGYPCFIKPSNSGSSVGVSKAKNREELLDGIEVAFKYDKKIVIEEGIVGKEVECAVLGNEELVVTTVGEIVHNSEFYDYETKYINNDSKAVIPAEISKDTISKIRQYSNDIYNILDCKGLSRLDFFIEKHTNEIIFNEINTLPGFTPISMYPMLIEDAGIPKRELIDRLINLAIEK